MKTDKNAHQEELAVQRFQELQQAYAVLSDPQERAWYDSHKDSILRGGDGTDDASSYQGINIWPYFNSSCYKGYGDNPGHFPSSFAHQQKTQKHVVLYPPYSPPLPLTHHGLGGFYDVYKKLFKQLDEEEDTYSSEGGEHSEAPEFGDSQSPWADVNTFYNYWETFSTRKTFAWCDKYNITTAENRRIKRLMEQENKKERSKAKRSFNENLR